MSEKTNIAEMTNPLGLSTIPSVSSEGLVPVGRRTSLRSYLAALWNRRHFIIAESRAKVSGSTRQNLLGYGWLFINPLLSVLAFWFIFGFILGTQKSVDNFIGYLVIGVFFFQYTSRSVTGGTGATGGGVEAEVLGLPARLREPGEQVPRGELHRADEQADREARDPEHQARSRRTGPPDPAR